MELAHSKPIIKSNTDIPKNSPTYPPTLLKRHGNSQIRYSVLKVGKNRRNKHTILCPIKYTWILVQVFCK